jgi:hypothetical protein
MNKYLKISLGLAVGGALGFAYYYFIGCNSGSCPITSNWHVSTLYGAFMGLVLVFPTKKKSKSGSK